MAVTAPNFRAIIAQHAKTAQLLGVDAVPVLAWDRPAQPHTQTQRANEHRSSGDDDRGDVSHAKPVAVHPSDVAVDTSVFSGPPSDITTLESLLARYIADAPHDKFGKPFTNIVFGEGDPDARLMFIGEAPGEDEDATGRPFVGKAGALLDKMIVAMGLRREQVYIANVLKTRPPNNETPTPEEAAASAPYLYEQIRLVNPEAIVTLGLSATCLLLGVNDSMGNLRGRWSECVRPARPPSSDGAAAHGFALSGAPVGPIPVMPTYHPSYLLRSRTPDNRAKVWSDLQMVMQRLGLQGRQVTSR